MYGDNIDTKYLSVYANLSSSALEMVNVLSHVKHYLITSVTIRPETRFSIIFVEK